MSNPIKDRRHEFGLSRAQMAIALNISVSLLAYWERSEALPTDEHLQFLAAFLGTEAEVLKTELQECRQQRRQRLAEQVAQVVSSPVAAVSAGGGSQCETCGVVTDS